MRREDCQHGRVVRYEGRLCTVGALAGDDAIVAIDGQFRSVPVVALEPALDSERMIGLIQDLGADALPDPDWQSSVWRRIAAEPRWQLWTVIGLCAAAVVVGLLVGWLVS